VSPTGPCCLVGEWVCELAPRRVMNTLSETAVLHHPIDRQVLHCNEITGVDHTTAALVGEVAPAPADALVRAGDDPAPLLAFLPRRVLVAILAHQAPDVTWVQVRVQSFGLSGKRRAKRLMGVHRHLMLPLGFGQGVFFPTKEARIVYGLACREHGKGV